MLLSLLLASGVATAQGLARYAAALVPVRTQLAGRGEEGSGFVVGSSPDSVYIVTAGHVLLEARAGVQVWLEGGRAWVPAQVRYLRNQEEFDLGLLAVPARQYRWPRLTLYPGLTPDDDLCFLHLSLTKSADETVGVDRQRLPAASQATMLAADHQAHTISFELAGVKPGDSGSALLVEAAGRVLVAGMILENGDPNTALSIDFIRQTLQPLLGSRWQLTD